MRTSRVPWGAVVAIPLLMCAVTSRDGVDALAGYVADAIVFVLDFILGTGSWAAT